jgi:hypothetical protein
VKINRHNYEEFFLLYVDNELSATDRKAVELFVQENADLKKELQMLQETVSGEDTIEFNNKTGLLKEEIPAMQENLLLYIDNELGYTDKLQIEKLISSDVSIAKELAILQQTKLQSDTSVIFKNKGLLYRKERTRVVVMPWRRIAAAAVLLGFGTWITVSLINKNKTEGNIVAIQERIKPATLKQPDNTAATVLQPQQTNITKVNTLNKAETNLVKQVIQKNNKLENTSLLQNTSAQKEDKIVAIKESNKKPNNNLPEPVYNNINNNSSNQIITANVPTTEVAIESLNSGNKTDNAATNTNSEVINAYALNTSFTDEPAAEINDNKILYMDEDNVKRTKLGGLIRRVKRMVERNTNIKTSNGIKVAGFNIASK